MTDQRIAFIEARDGIEAAKVWALDTARTYRITVLRRHARWRKPGQTAATHLMYRIPMIRCYLEMKAYALAPTWQRPCPWCKRDHPERAPNMVTVKAEKSDGACARCIAAMRDAIYAKKKEMA